jgi:hypothetical protein
MGHDAPPPSFRGILTALHDDVAVTPPQIVAPVVEHADVPAPGDWRTRAERAEEMLARGLCAVTDGDTYLSAEHCYRRWQETRKALQLSEANRTHETGELRVALRAAEQRIETLVTELARVVRERDALAPTAEEP